MSGWGFVAESVTATLTGLLISDTYAAMRPRLSETLSRIRGSESPRIEELDRLRGEDPAVVSSAVQVFVQRLEAVDSDLLRELQDACRAQEPHMNIYGNKIVGPAQFGGTQIVNMGGGS